MEYGFVKVASAVPVVKVADCLQNIKEIESLIAQAEGRNVELIVFPELCITGYSCQDLFRQQLLLDAAEHSLMQLLDFSRQLDIISVVGLPVVVGGQLLNCAAVIQRGSILGIVPKTYLPNYNEFYEKRWFASAQDLRPTEIHIAGHNVIVTPDPQLFRTCEGVTFGVEICEDVWGAHATQQPPHAGRGRDCVQPTRRATSSSASMPTSRPCWPSRVPAPLRIYLQQRGLRREQQDVVYGGTP
jgi:NAD+ synthase (glutamine-hydrolysing)